MKSIDWMAGVGAEGEVKVANLAPIPHEPKRWNFAHAPKCGAKNRRGTPCQAPAMRGRRRCRLHGGKSTGPKTQAGIRSIQRANTKHGFYSKASKRERAEIR